MVLLPQQPSLNDFLAWENQQVEKHEFHFGEVLAMVGGQVALDDIFRGLEPEDS